MRRPWVLTHRLTLDWPKAARIAAIVPKTKWVSDLHLEMIA